MVLSLKLEMSNTIKNILIKEVVNGAVSTKILGQLFQKVTYTRKVKNLIIN